MVSIIQIKNHRKSKLLWYKNQGLIDSIYNTQFYCTRYLQTHTLASQNLYRTIPNLLRRCWHKKWPFNLYMAHSTHRYTCGLCDRYNRFSFYFSIWNWKNFYNNLYISYYQQQLSLVTKSSISRWTAEILYFLFIPSWTYHIHPIK